jgi:hypothetical protein
MILEIFLPCYFNNELAVASSKLSTALFHSNWTRGSKKFKHLMKVFMEGTKRDIKIMAFGVFELNLKNFTAVVNSAYTLYALIKNINEL